ncbi:MAG: hypothetical protein WC251_02720, partial [Candidatus Izemoplasmatales bacterium]
MSKNNIIVILGLLFFISGCGSNTESQNSSSSETSSSSDSSPIGDDYYQTIEDRVAYSSRDGLDFTDRFDD